MICAFCSGFLPLSYYIDFSLLFYFVVINAHNLNDLMIIVVHNYFADMIYIPILLH